jgi:fatty acid-binding protein DegV
MMKIIALSLLLVGCAATGAKSPAATFTQLLAAAESANDAVVVVATSSLQAGTITSAQAKKVLTITDGVNTALTLANTVYLTGDLATATAKLAAATAILTTVQSCVTAANAKLMIDTCLAPTGN